MVLQLHSRRDRRAPGRAPRRRGGADRIGSADRSMTSESYPDALRDLALGDDRFVVLTAKNRAAIRGLRRFWESDSWTSGSPSRRSWERLRDSRSEAGFRW